VSEKRRGAPARKGTAATAKPGSDSPLFGGGKKREGSERKKKKEDGKMDVGQHGGGLNRAFSAKMTGHRSWEEMASETAPSNYIIRKPCRRA